MTGAKIITLAEKYLGYSGSKFWTDYGLPSGSHWCCAFVWDIFRIAGASRLFFNGKKTAYVPTAQIWLKANCQKVSLANAKAGDIVVFTWGGNGYNKEVGSRDHIGLIRKKGTSKLCYTVEGNTGGSTPYLSSVMNRTREAKYIYGIYRPAYVDTFTVKFKARGGEGKMASVKVKVGASLKLPANTFTRAGFKFMGWSKGKSDVITMDRFQIGKVKYKNKATVKICGKADQVITLYACWKGVGVEAAALWARKLARDNSFMYGADDHKNWYHGRDRAHQVGCYFCGTNRTGVKKAKKGDRWDKTYCCNSFVMAAFVHGMGMFKKCKGGSTYASYWTKLEVNGKPAFKVIGKNVKYSDLKAGDIMCNGSHIKMFTGKSKDGDLLVTHAAGEGWTKKSIRTEKVKGRIGSDYTALRYKLK